MFSFLQIMFSAAFQFVKPLLIEFMTQEGAILIKEAANAVSTVAKTLTGTDITNAQKRDAAFDIIKNSLVSQGKTIADSTINAAIEVAVKNIKVASKS